MQTFIQFCSEAEKRENVLRQEISDGARSAEEYKKNSQIYCILFYAKFWHEYPTAFTPKANPPGLAQLTKWVHKSQVSFYSVQSWAFVNWSNPELHLIQTRNVLEVTTLLSETCGRVLPIPRGSPVLFQHMVANSSVSSSALFRMVSEEEPFSFWNTFSNIPVGGGSIMRKFRYVIQAMKKITIIMYRAVSVPSRWFQLTGLHSAYFTRTASIFKCWTVALVAL